MKRSVAASKRGGDEVLELPESCEYPQLRDIADSRLLASRLAGALAAAKAAAPPLRRCTLRKVHYRPRSGCRLVIEARFGSGPGIGSEQLFFGRLLPGDGARREFEAPPRTAPAAARFGPPRLYVPEWKLLLWAYPNDPELPGLPMLSDVRRVHARFSAEPATFGLDEPPRSVTSERVKYVPGKRCGYFYRVESGASPRGRRTTHRIYGKCYSGDEAAHAHDVAMRAWRSEARTSERFLMPQPYACDEAQAIVWQEALVGRPLLKRRGQAERLFARAGEIGVRLAALHGADLGLPVEMTHASQVKMLRRSLAEAKALPEDQARAAIELGERLLAMAERFPEPASATLHGSFRLSHVMVTRRGLAFIDLDGANSGDAACDLGRFIAHLLRLGALGSLAQGTARHGVTEFCRGYASKAAVPVGRERIGWSSAVHLVSGGLDKAMKRLGAAALDALTAAAVRICPL